MNFRKFQITHLIFIFRRNHTPVTTSAVTSSNFAYVNVTLANFEDATCIKLFL